MVRIGQVLHGQGPAGENSIVELSEAPKNSLPEMAFRPGQEIASHCAKGVGNSVLLLLSKAKLLGNRKAEANAERLFQYVSKLEHMMGVQ